VKTAEKLPKSFVFGKAQKKIPENFAKEFCHKVAIFDGYFSEKKFTTYNSSQIGEILQCLVTLREC
jgi:hypothetical protein